MNEPPLIGGDPVLDLVNTAAWRGDPGRRVDRLTSAAALVDWMSRTGLLDPTSAEVCRDQIEADPAGAADVVEQARRLREDVHRVLTALLDDGVPREEDVEALRVVMVRALAHARLASAVPLRWQVPGDRLAELPAVLGLAVWRLFQFADLTRVGRCADPACGWLFLDTSRNASRRWCSSTDCGNRARARRHHQRRRGSAQKKPS